MSDCSSDSLIVCDDAACSGKRLVYYFQIVMVAGSSQDEKLS